MCLWVESGVTLMATITLKVTTASDYMVKGCRWLDGAWDTVFEIEQIWKNAIQLRNVKTGETMRMSNRRGMTKVNSWRPLKGKEFKASFGNWKIEGGRVVALPDNAQGLAL